MLYAAGSIDTVRAAVREVDQMKDPLTPLSPDSYDYSNVYRMVAPEEVGKSYEDLFRQTINACMLAKVAMLSDFIMVRVLVFGTSTIGTNHDPR